MTDNEIEMALETIALVLEDLKKTQEKQQSTITALEEALAEHAMRETQRLGQEIEQEPVAWPCLIDSADFSENTITFVMQCEDYKVSAGTHWLSTTPPKRTWVELTDEQVNEYNYLGPDMPWVVREVAAILKERNQ